MADSNSTLSKSNDIATTDELVNIVGNYCFGIEAFFELAEREIKEHNSTDLDNMEFLLRAARAELNRFSELVSCRLNGEVSHA